MLANCHTVSLGRLTLIEGSAASVLASVTRASKASMLILPAVVSSSPSWTDIEDPPPEPAAPRYQSLPAELSQWIKPERMQKLVHMGIVDRSNVMLTSI